MSAFVSRQAAIDPRRTIESLREEFQLTLWRPVHANSVWRIEEIRVDRPCCRDRRTDSGEGGIEELPEGVASLPCSSWAFR
ncbi:MAG: hypothetical protein R3B96_16210 [Pirellulaceae bacterium]